MVLVVFADAPRSDRCQFKLGIVEAGGIVVGVDLGASPGVS